MEFNVGLYFPYKFGVNFRRILLLLMSVAHSVSLYVMLPFMNFHVVIFYG